ncbi:MAG: hypothetical protein EOP49_05985 [Sphingobacteriales bacterium]|nr:MAG: hypothetical protein EOP49_05985 [Sphingobacteriales bacterium]
MRKALLIAALTLSALPSMGQGCSICTKTAAGLDDKSAKGMNSGILYLAAFPLTIMGTIGFIWWKANRK